MREFKVHIEYNKERKITKCVVLIEGKPATIEDLTDEELGCLDDNAKNLIKENRNEQH